MLEIIGATLDIAEEDGEIAAMVVLPSDGNVCTGVGLSIMAAFAELGLSIQMLLEEEAYHANEKKEL